VDARPGGAIRIDMRGPDGTVYPMKGTFHEVDAPARLVFTSTAMEDEHGKPHLEILNTITFADEGGKTKLTMTARVVTAIDVDGPLSGMEQGWNETLDRLGAFIRGMRA
jgi:uncharacterized protein YndB with AHSA1/START domain